MKLMAFYRNDRNDDLNIMIDSDYTSKKAFSDDIRANGYRVVGVANKEELKNPELIKNNKFYNVLSDYGFSDLLDYFESH